MHSVHLVLGDGAGSTPGSSISIRREGERQDSADHEHVGRGHVVGHAASTRMRSSREVNKMIIGGGMAYTFLKIKEPWETV